METMTWKEYLQYQLDYVATTKTEIERLKKQIEEIEKKEEEK